MKLYPIFFNIENRLAIVIGGGEVGYRKVKDLIDADARIKIISPEIHNGIKELKNKNINRVDIIQREYQYGDIEGASLVYSSTNDTKTNRKVFEEAEEKGIFINSVDDPENCSFYVPSLVRKGDMILAVSTSGASPAMAAKLRRILEKSIPTDIEDILASLQEARSILKNLNNLTSSDRGKILKKIVNDDNLLSQLISNSKNGQIEEFIKSLL